MDFYDKNLVVMMTC